MGDTCSCCITGDKSPLSFLISPFPALYAALTELVGLVGAVADFYLSISSRCSCQTKAPLKMGHEQTASWETKVYLHQHRRHPSHHITTSSPHLLYQLTMRVVIALFVVAAVAFCTVDARVVGESDYQGLFTSFVKKYNKEYSHDEFFSRYNIFKNNFDKIREHNKVSGGNGGRGMMLAAHL